MSSTPRSNPDGALPDCSRRRWLAGAAAAVLAACEPPQQRSQDAASHEETDPLEERIIDAHVHVWTPDTAAYPISAKSRKDQMDPPSFTPEELFAHCRPLGVNRINLIQMSFYQDDHRYMLDAIARHPGIFAGTGLLTDITSEGSRPGDRMRELGDQGLRAFRLVGQAASQGARWMDHPNYAGLFRIGAERNLILSFLVNPGDLAEVDRLCREYPETPVIIDHLARIRMNSASVAADTEALLRLAERPRVFVKVGAFYALSIAGPPYQDLLPLIEQVVSAFGPERCMWESDSPFQAQPPHTYGASLALVREHASFATPSARQWILRRTAESLLFS